MNAERQHVDPPLPDNVVALPVREPHEQQDDHLTRRHYDSAYQALEDARTALTDVCEAFTGSLIVSSDDVQFRLHRAVQLVEACQVAWLEQQAGKQ
jgi:hypothetical protein